METCIVFCLKNAFQVFYNATKSNVEHLFADWTPSPARVKIYNVSDIDHEVCTKG